MSVESATPSLRFFARGKVIIEFGTGVSASFFRGCMSHDVKGPLSAHASESTYPNSTAHGLHPLAIGTKMKVQSYAWSTIPHHLRTCICLLSLSDTAAGFQVHGGIGAGPARFRQAREEGRRRRRRRQVRGQEGPQAGAFGMCWCFPVCVQMCVAAPGCLVRA